ncbi:CBS domain-containing protein [Pararhizobium sp.]|uniref:CBS domain-containing protein n=1 Tax=Pararhizobium sp. TaxID=1977563 RepID=UPI002715F65F|nr:CBS domain-containing protein [Pararhizobium sp.]MDO9415342.1 CBS domain-containing protein [Pararhizobium sp.]
MSVRAILNEKGRNVVTVGSQMTIRQAAKFLNENHIGAVVIVDTGDKIGGILTERDIVAAVAQHGPEGLEKPVASVMWSNVFRCGEDTTIEDLMAMMSSKRARHIVVEKDGHLAGIISIGDVVKSHIRAIEQEAAHIKAYIAG